jgi:hypothetical protein
MRCDLTRKGLVMSLFVNACRAAAIVASTLIAPAAWSAAPDALPAEESTPLGTGIGAPIDYALETEMVVRNWVLCVSQPLAEQLARAREAGAESARTTYADLAGARSCGLFPELRVILQQSLYVSSGDAGYDARVFGALVNLSGDWATAFVVSGSLSE